jgi:hypothetical protein
LNATADEQPKATSESGIASGAESSIDFESSARLILIPEEPHSCATRCTVLTYEVESRNRV